MIYSKKKELVKLISNKCIIMRHLTTNFCFNSGVFPGENFFVAITVVRSTYCSLAIFVTLER